MPCHSVSKFLHGKPESLQPFSSSMTFVIFTLVSTTSLKKFFLVFPAAPCPRGCPFLFFLIFNITWTSSFRKPRRHQKARCRGKSLQRWCKKMADTARPLGNISSLSKHIPRPKFNMSTPNGVHLADLLFLPHNSEGHGQGRKKSIYALTVVEAEP